MKTNLCNEAGFSLIEVMVSVMILVLFFSATMQAAMVSAVMRLKAQKNVVAMNWIQQDLEAVKQSAALVGLATLTAAPTSTSTTSSLPVDSTVGFAVGNRIKIGSINRTLFTISTLSTSPRTLTVTPALTAGEISEIAVGAPVSVAASGTALNTLCYAKAKTVGLGNLLASHLPALNSSNNTKTIGDDVYTLSRSAPVITDREPERMQLSYEVSQGAESVVKLTAEVIPEAAFHCPPY